MAANERKIRITMAADKNVVGEEGETLYAGKTYTVSEWFGRELIARKKAVPADEKAGGAEKAGKNGK